MKLQIKQTRAYRIILIISIEGIILHKLLINIIVYKNTMFQWYWFQEHKDDSILGNQSVYAIQK